MKLNIGKVYACVYTHTQITIPTNTIIQCVKPVRRKIILEANRENTCITYRTRIKMIVDFLQGKMRYNLQANDQQEISSVLNPDF